MADVLETKVERKNRREFFSHINDTRKRISQKPQEIEKKEKETIL